MAPEEAPLAPAADKRILVADGQPEVVEYLEMVLKKEGFRVETAADGQEALQKAQTLIPDLILLDLKLPKLQGLEILRELQAGETSRIPVFIITGHMANRETEALVRMEANVKGYYTKPVNAAALAMNVHSLLRTKPAFRTQSLGW